MRQLTDEEVNEKIMKILDEESVFDGIPEGPINMIEVTTEDRMLAAQWCDKLRPNPLSGPDRLDHEDRTFNP